MKTRRIVLKVLLPAVALVTMALAYAGCCCGMTGTTGGPSGPRETIQLCTAYNAENVCPTHSASFVGASSPQIRVSYVTTTRIPQANSTIKVALVAEQTASAPTGTELAAANIQVPSVVIATWYNVTGTFTAPPTGWPVGQYRVDILYGTEKVAEMRFSIT